MVIGRRPWKTTGLLVLALCAASSAAAAPATAGPAQRARVLSEYGKLPIQFEENRGQTDARVRFLSRGSGYALFLTPSEAVISVGGRAASTPATVRMQFSGANAAPVVEGQDALPGKTSYIIGRDPDKWRTNVPSYAKVAYRNIYRGIDLVYYGNQRELEYDFVVAPGADPKRIRMRFEGASSMSVNEGGDLVLTAGAGALHQRRPVVYQDIDGQRRSIDGRYVIEGDEVRFEIARYDARKPLVIDPVLAWGSYLGGENLDVVNSIAVDAQGSAYATGSTFSAAFPNPGFNFQPRGLEQDVFVTKFAVAGNALVYTVFIGGEKSEQGTDVAVDAAGNAFVTGWTESTTLPGTAGRLQSILGGGRDAFVAKVGSTGAFLWATYLGGFGTDDANAIALDSTGRPVVAGTTTSSNFYATVLQAAFNSPQSEGFITKLNADGTGPAPVWSTYFGSTGAEAINGLAIDSADSVYIAGRTTSSSLVFANGTIQRGIARIGIADAFVAKLAANGSAVTYWTYLGGVGYDEAVDIAVDSSMNAYVLGYTDSADYPLLNPIQGANAGVGDMFLTKLNPAGTARVYSTFIGGAGADNPAKLAVDATGAAYIVGSTASTNYPLADALQLTNSGSRDLVVTQVNAAGTGYLFSTYMGTVLDDVGTGIAIDPARNIYLAGTTQTTFPYVTTNSAQAAFGGGVQDGFVVKLSNCPVTLSQLSRVHTLLGNPKNLGEISTITITADPSCQWVAAVEASANWVAITSANSGSGNGSITYLVGQNGSAPRSASISIGGQRFTVEQEGVPLAQGCIYPLEPEAAIVNGANSSGTFRIPTLTGCSWTATSNQPWVQVYPLNGTGSTTAQYTVFPNYGTTIRNATITITGGGFSRQFAIAQANTFLSDRQRMVTLAYFGFLGRYPSQEELDFHVNSMTAFNLTAADVLTNFFNSDEFAVGGRFIAGLYVGLLNRDAEYGGWLFQRNALASGLVNQPQLVDNFLNSAEFRNKYPNLTDDQFVTLLYNQVLGRFPSTFERTFQLQQIAAVGRTAVATAFLSSAEFRQRLNGRLSAFLLYATLLQRGPNAGEQATRQLQIDTGTPIRTLIGDFAGSNEFKALLQCSPCAF